jgi:hypothetical protein
MINISNQLVQDPQSGFGSSPSGADSDIIWRTIGPSESIAKLSIGQPNGPKCGISGRRDLSGVQTHELGWVEGQPITAG